jgi:hypothetical protein
VRILVLDPASRSVSFNSISRDQVKAAAFSNLVSISQLPALLPDNNLETHIKSLPLFNQIPGPIHIYSLAATQHPQIVSYVCHQLMAKFDARDQSTVMDSFCSFDGVDWVYQQKQSRPMRARHSSSSTVLDRQAAAKAPPIPRRSSEDSGATTTKDITSLNQLWDTIRQQKQRQMAKEPPKVNSLKAPTPIHSPTPSRTQDPVVVRKVVTPQPLKRRKSK